MTLVYVQVIAVQAALNMPILTVSFPPALYDALSQLLSTQVHSCHSEHRISTHLLFKPYFCEGEQNYYSN